MSTQQLSNSQLPLIVHGLFRILEIVIAVGLPNVKLI